MLMQITDGHPAPAADAARRRTDVDRYNTAERVVLVALLRHAREKSLKQRLFAVAAAPGGDAGGSNYSLGERRTTGN